MPRELFPRLNPRDLYQGDPYWWSPGQIAFSRLQVLWLLRYVDLLQQGLWPPEAKESIKGRSLVAPFVQPLEIWIELDYRLRQTNSDGKLLLRQVLHEEVCLEPESRTALQYISGRKRKATSYKSWLRDYRKRRVLVNKMPPIPGFRIAA
jgi:hypothetical protein